MHWYRTTTHFANTTYNKNVNKSVYVRYFKRSLLHLGHLISFRYCNYDWLTNCNCNYDLDLNQTFIEKRDLDQHQFDGENGTETKFLEVIYVADQYAIEQYGMVELPEMLMSMGNTVRIDDRFYFSICFLVFYLKQWVVHCNEKICYMV